MYIIMVIFISHRPPFSSIYRALEANEVMRSGDDVAPTKE